MPDNPLLEELEIEQGNVPQFGGAGQEMTSEIAEQMGLLGIMGDLGIEPDKLKYFEQYDPIKEEMAGMARGQSEQEAQQQLDLTKAGAQSQFEQAIAGAQGQVGQALGQVYAKGRAGGGGFGGSTPSVGAVGQQAMRGYGQARGAAREGMGRTIMGAEQQYTGQMFDAQMAEAKAIKASRDAYQQQIMQLLGMLQE